MLQELCKVRNLYPTFMGSENPITNRAKYIIDHLPSTPNLDVFEAYDPTLSYVNIELSFDVGSEQSIIFVAHHDIVNINSDNCLDNSASVVNLIAFAHMCRVAKLNKSIHVVFTDCEEFGGRGAQRLSERINDGVFGNVEYVVNLELTACGTRFLCENVKDSRLCRFLLDDGFAGVSTPFNDSVILRANDIDSICITIIPDEELLQVLRTGYCETWSLCHQSNDVVENAIEEDMNKFLEYLKDVWITNPLIARK